MKFFNFELNDMNYYKIIDYKGIKDMSLQTKCLYIAELDKVLEEEFGYIEPDFYPLKENPELHIRYDMFDTIKRFRDKILDSLVNDRVKEQGLAII